jgi:hypothetical protein
VNGDGKATDSKTKYDDRYAGTHPREKRAFIGEMISGIIRVFVAY